MSGRESPSVVEVEFELTDDRYPFVRISDRAGCQFELLDLLPRDGGRYAEFFSVVGADPAAVRDRAESADLVDARLLASHDSTGLLEFEVTDECPVVALAVQEAIPREVISEDGTARIEAEIPPPREPAAVVDGFRDDHPDASLVEVTETDRSAPLFTRRELARTLRERLTDRQLEVLRAAHEAGYYERPREATGEAVAEQLDITVATFSQHVRAAERHLFELLFETDVIPDSRFQ